MESRLLKNSCGRAQEAWGWGFGSGRVSGATPAPWDAPQGAVRRTMWCIVDEPEHSGAPRPRRPSGLPRGRAPSVLALLTVPPARRCRAAWNLHRPRAQRAGSLPGAEPQDARRGEEGDVVHRGRAGTTQVAPNPLRPKGCRGTAASAVLALLSDGHRIGGVAPSCIRSRGAGNAAREVSQQPARARKP